MKHEELIKLSLSGDALKAYTKLCDSCKDNDEYTVGTSHEEEIILTPEELQSLVGQIEDAVLEETEPQTIVEVLEREALLSRTLYLNDAVSMESIDYMIQLIHKWNRDDEGLTIEERQPIKIFFNTEGGEAYSGSALIGAISNSKTPTHGIVEGGMCMSMGLMLWLSTSYRTVNRFSNILYHALRAGSDTRTLAEMKVVLEHYENMQNMMDELILEKTSVPKNILEQKKNSNLDWHITFKELKEYNFAHEYN